MASLFEYEREAIRVRARRVDQQGRETEMRKFSVDPNITSFEVLQSILSRAFELPAGEMAVSYRQPGQAGEPGWAPLLSDWDLDTAILGSAEQAAAKTSRLTAGEPGS